MSIVHKLLLLLAFAWLSAGARAADLVVLVDTGTDMPLARFEAGKVVGGIHFDVGSALARQLGRQARFVPLPRKRIPFALEDGTGDVLCMYLPEWVGGNFDWSQAFFPQAEVLLTAKRAARPASISDVAGQLVGTVHGYAYPEMELALGVGFKRADGPSTELNIEKLAAGRVDHALANDLWFRWRLRQGNLGVEFHPPLIIHNIVTACAVSRRGRVRVDEVNRALQVMQKDGTVAAIVRRY